MAVHSPGDMEYVVRVLVGEAMQVTDPLDLDAINEELAGAGCLRPRTAAKVLAEVERLRAESVPRSALVAVGVLVETSDEDGIDRRLFVRGRHDDKEEPVYVIREDADA